MNFKKVKILFLLILIIPFFCNVNNIASSKGTNIIYEEEFHLHYGLVIAELTLNNMTYTYNPTNFEEKENNTAHLYFDFSSIDNYNYICAIDFLVENESYERNLFFNLQYHYFYNDSSNKVYVPLIFSPNNSESLENFVTISRNNPKTISITSDDIGDEKYGLPISYLDFGFFNYYAITIPYPEGHEYYGSVSSILQYEAQNNFLTYGSFTNYCFEIFLKFIFPNFTYVSGNPDFYLLDTNFELLSDPSRMESPINSVKSAFEIIGLVVLFGVPLIFTILWKKNQNKIKKPKILGRK